MKSWFRVGYCWQRLLAGKGGCAWNRLDLEALEAQPLQPGLGVEGALGAWRLAGLEIDADPKRDPNVIKKLH